MTDELNIKVDLDSSPAKQQFKMLGKKGAKMTRRVATSSARRVSRSITGVGGLSFGVGAILGNAGIGRILGRGRKGPVDPWEQAMVPVQAAVQTWVDKKMGYSASARMSAVSMTAQKMAVNSYFMNETDSAQKYYNVVEPMQQLQQQGLNVVRETMKGPELDDIIAQAAKGYANLIGRAFTYFYDKLAG